MSRPKKKNTNGEMILFRILDNIIPFEHVNHGYYSFLLTPRGGKMQLDRYYPGLNLAFEFQGTPHDTYFPEIHGSYEEFEYYQECDAIKKRICKERGITLIEVKYNHILTDEAILLDIKKHNSNLWRFIMKERRLMEQEGEA